MRIGLVRGLVASLLLLPGISLALGLGDVHLNSPLNAPLDAEIELVNATPGRSRHARCEARVEGDLCALRPRMAAVHGQHHGHARSLGERRAGPAHQIAARPSPSLSSPCSSKRRGRVAAWCVNTPCCWIRRYSPRMPSPPRQYRHLRSAPVKPRARSRVRRPRPASSPRYPVRPGRRWRQLRSAARRQPLGHRAPPVRQHAVRAPTS